MSELVAVLAGGGLALIGAFGGQIVSARTARRDKSRRLAASAMSSIEVAFAMAVRTREDNPSGYLEVFEQLSPVWTDLHELRLLTSSEGVTQALSSIVELTQNLVTDIDTDNDSWNETVAKHNAASKDLQELLEAEFGTRASRLQLWRR